MTDKGFDIDYVANLSRLALNKEERETFSQQLSNILGFVDKLSELQVENVEPMAQAAGLKSFLREDAVKDSLPVAKALENAPAKEESSFLVPPPIE